MTETSYSTWDPIRATRQNQDIQREVEDTAMMDIQVSRQPCAGDMREDFTITKKAPTRAFSWLKAPTSAFTFKKLSRHYAKQAMQLS